MKINKYLMKNTIKIKLKYVYILYMTHNKLNKELEIRHYVRNNKFRYFKKGYSIDDLYTYILKNNEEEKKTIEDLLNMKERPSYIPEYHETEIKDKYLILIDGSRQNASYSRAAKLFKFNDYYESKNYIKWIEENEYNKTKHYIIYNVSNELKKSRYLREQKEQKDLKELKNNISDVKHKNNIRQSYNENYNYYDKIEIIPQYIEMF